jgi:catechol 2,3-dioxygenase-like lactoylglutathione lyase family enzyme
VEFYTNVLGFSISAKIEMGEVGLSAIFIEKNGSKIELMGYRGAIPKRSEGIEITMGGNSIPINDHITFSVDDIGATVTELKEKGVKFGMEPIQLEGGMKLTSFKDPNGVLIELVEHPKQQKKSTEYIIV